MTQETERTAGHAVFDEYVRATEENYKTWHGRLIEGLQRLGAWNGLAQFPEAIRAGIYREAMREARRRADACKDFAEMKEMMRQMIAGRTEDALRQLCAPQHDNPFTAAQLLYVRQCEASLLLINQWSLASLLNSIEIAERRFYADRQQQAA